MTDPVPVSAAPPPYPLALALSNARVNRLYTFQLHAGNSALQAELEKWMSVAGKWDQPEIDLRMIAASDRNTRRSRNEQN